MMHNEHCRGRVSHHFEWWRQRVLGLGSFLLLLLFAATATAQDLKLPAEVKAERGRLAQIVIESKGAETKYDIFPPHLDHFREWDADPKVIKLRVLARLDGEYWVVASTAVGDKVSMEKCRLVVGGGTPPVPPPDDPPKPPPPDDPLTKALRAALVKDTAAGKGNKAHVQTLSDVYRVAAADIPSGTLAQLLAKLQSTVTTMGVPPASQSLTHLRNAIADELDARLGKADRTITLEDRNRITATFNTLADVLEVLAK